VRLTSLRTRLFRQAVEEAFASGRIPASIATLSDAGVHLREPALLPRDGAHEVFEIDFAQMCRLAALLDFLHNALGFSVVADVLAPLLQRGTPSSSANEVARTLQAALNGWLSERLESTNHILQAQRIRAFLASRGRVAPEAVDDEGILQFWIAMADAGDNERIDGFRLYRSVAAAMLRYRNALRDATAARHLEDALERGWEPANDEIGSDRIGTRLEVWRSPLQALAVPPANRVKWLTGKEQNVLINYLGGPADRDEEASGEESEAGAWKGGLFGEDRFDVAFWLTLLRADVFGAAQASIVARLRKRATGREAIAQAMAPVDDAAYIAAAAAYVNLREQLRLEILAALALLMEAGAPEAVILLDGLGARQIAEAAIGPVADGATADGEDDGVVDSLHEKLAPALKAVIADPSSVPEGAARGVLLEAIAAPRKVSRVGFRREDRADAEMLAALRASAIVIFDIVHELDRLTARLAQKTAEGDVIGDNARFLAAFERIYLSAAE
jgi:hypothetical protein